jgi:general secretion pathway protein I
MSSSRRACRRGAGSSAGFTLLEVLVATMLLGIAVVGLLTNVNTSMRNASRLTDYDRASLLAKRQMDALLVDRRLPRFGLLQGDFDPVLMGGVPAGWRARLTIFEAPPGAPGGSLAMERIEFEVWWGDGPEPRRLQLEAFRPGVLTVEEAQAGRGAMAAGGGAL